MKIELLSYNDRTHIITLDIDEEGKQYLVELGFNTLLAEALRKEELCTKSIGQACPQTSPPTNFGSQ